MRTGMMGAPEPVQSGAVTVRREPCADAGQNRPGGYGPRHPEETVLYRVMAGHLETFLARQQQRGRHVPKFVEREMREFLTCGQLAGGFLRFRCEACGREKLLPFSCKGRAVCASCCGRRMADTAAHLVDRVFPEVPVRQWVLSLPHPVRYRLAYDADLLTAVLHVFVRAVFGLLRRQAREVGIEPVQCGAVVFIQRFSDSLALNPHFHAMVLDGVYAPGRGVEPEFFPLHAPEEHEVAALAQTLAERIPALLRRRGLDAGACDPEEPDPLPREQPWLAEVYAASVCNRIADGPNAGRQPVSSGDRIDPEALDVRAIPRCAAVSGYSVHPNVFIPGHDRPRLERLLRYAARPPLAAERLEETEDGRLIYRFKKAWRNGTTHAVFTPLELLERLAALVPTPRAHLTRYFGILAPAAPARPLVVPGSSSSAAAVMAPSVAAAAALVSSASPEAFFDSTAAAAGSTAESGLPPKDSRHPRNYAWAELIRRVFLTDALACEHCGGKLRLVSAIHPPEATRKILDCLGLPSRPPPVAPARLDPQLSLASKWL
jgi:hypothetical protein